MKYMVMCQVSGGVTGIRQSPLRDGSDVIIFPTQQTAQVQAEYLMNKRPINSVAKFFYWVEVAD